MNKFALFTGCLIASKLPQLEASAVAVLKKLKVESELADGFACCPDPFSMKILNREAWYALAARNLCVAEQNKLDVLTLCNGCNLTLSKVNNDLTADAELRTRVNITLKRVGKQFEGRIEVKSILRTLFEDVGSDEIEKLVQNPLTKVRAALHYGCHIFEELKKFDDAKSPQSLTRLVEATGATVVPYSKQTLCCGSLAQFCNDDVYLKIVEEKLLSVTRSGANCMIVICPYCFLQYDLGQALIEKRFRKSFRIPVLYYPQLLALAIGLPLRDVGLHYHHIVPDGRLF